MGLKYRKYLDGALIYGCAKCNTHLTTGDAIVSRVGIHRVEGGEIATTTTTKSLVIWRGVNWLMHPTTAAISRSTWSSLPL